MNKFIELNNKVKIPAVALGVYQTDVKVAEEVVYTALEAGYRHIDSAAGYGNEKECSTAIAKFCKDKGVPREEIFYTTKIWNNDQGYEPAKKKIEECLQNASDIKYIDLLLIHTPMTNYEKRHGTWLAFQEAVDSGTVKSIGVSNYGIKHLKELLAYPELKYKPVVNQVELHPWLQRVELVKFCRDNGIELEAYSPLVRGKKFGDPTLVELSKKYNVSEAQILIKWSLEQGFITLPKSVTKERIISNAQLDFSITKEDLSKLGNPAKDEILGWDPTVYALDHENADDFKVYV